MTVGIKSQVTAQAVQTGLTNYVLAERRKPSCQPRWSPPWRQNEKEDVVSLGIAFGRLNLTRMCNDSRHRGRHTEPRESLEKGSLRRIGETLTKAHSHSFEQDSQATSKIESRSLTYVIPSYSSCAFIGSVPIVNNLTRPGAKLCQVIWQIPC